MSGVPLTGEIEPINGGDFPVFQDTNGKGGLRTVANAAARDAITAPHKKVGMVVVLADTFASYQWNGSAWVDYTAAPSLAVHTVTPAGGSSPVLDFSAHNSLAFDMNQDCSPTFVAPASSRILTLNLTQSGAPPDTSYEFDWPENVFSPPNGGLPYTLNSLVGEEQFILFYSKEADVYYPIGQTSDDVRNLSLVSGALGSVTTALNQLDFNGPRTLTPPVNATISFTAPLHFGSFYPVTPNDNIQMQFNCSLAVDVKVTSGSVNITLNWVDQYERARSMLVASVAVGDPSFEYASGTLNICPKPGSAVTVDIAAGDAIIGGNPTITYALSFGRIDTTHHV